MPQATPKRKYALVRISVPGQAVRTVVFDTQDLSIGRSPENDVAIEHPEISRRHVVLTRCDGGCAVQDMGTSNGTTVNGEPVQRARIQAGDRVAVADVEMLYLEETRSPASLGVRIEYASQLKSLRMPNAPAAADGDATILGLMDPVSGSDDDFQVGPASEFEYDLHDMRSAPSAPRDLDAELEDFGEASIEDLSLEGPARSAPASPPRAAAPRQAPPTPAPAPKSPAHWDLDELGGSGAVSLHVELEGLSPELRRIVESLVGKTVALPSLRIRIKADDLA